MNRNKIACILQARISSTRLPGKILLNGFNKSLLLHTVERLKKSKKLDKIIIATTTLKIDDIIVDICKKNKLNVFRGHPTNLLSRYYNCAIKFKLKNIVRITSDCPLMDYRIIDLMIKKYNEKKIDYLSNIHPPTLPDGFDIEIFTFEALKKTYLSANQDFQKEHVTPFIWDNPKKFLIKNFVYKKIKNLYNKYRLTLDYKEDYYVISKIYNALYFKNKFFSLEDILKYINKNPSIMINKKFIKVNWYKDHLKKLKTIKKKDTKNIKN